MANPRNKKSVDRQQAAGAGKETRSNGHADVTLFVHAENFNSGDGDELTVALEGSPDGQKWDTLDNDQGNAASISGGGLTSGQTGLTQSIAIEGAYYEFLRANVTVFTDALNADLVVDAWVMASGNSGSGTRGNPEQY